MKKVLFFTIAFCLSVTTALKAIQKNNTQEDITSANIDALASNESLNDYRQPKTESCDLQEGEWHTASVKRVCVFSATPRSCTPVKCGEPFYN